MRREEPLEEHPRIDWSGALDELEQLPEPGKQEQDEGDGGEQTLEGQRAREKGDAVLIGGLEGPPDEPPN
jgi:hypothetical protein